MDSRGVELWRERWRRLAGREPTAEVDDELAFHLEERTRELLALGIDEQEARERAQRRFGDLAAIRGECMDLVRRRERRMARSESISDFLQDLRFSLRALRRRPGFAAVAVSTLALGIGANSAIFSVVDAVLVRPLPYQEPERLVSVYHANPSQGVWDGNFSPPDLDDASSGLRRLSGVGAYFFMPGQSGVNLRGLGAPARLWASSVSAGFFPTLGVDAAVGRTLLPAENVAGRDRVAVISDRLWRSRFGGDRTVIGRKLSLDGEPFEVVGVMPPSFAFPSPEVDVWQPLSLIGEDDIPTLRGLRWLSVIGRLAPGATVEGARAELDQRLASLAAAHRDTNEGWDRAAVVTLQRDLVGDVAPVLRVVFAAVGFVLLIACTNLVNLLLARGTSRLQELAIRSALGAERRRLVRQLLTEGLALSLLGGVCGLALGVGGVRLLVRLAGDQLPRAGEIHPDLRLIGFTFGVAVVAALLFGLLPALRWSRSAGAAALREGSRGAVGGGERERLRGLLVVAETALAVLLMIGAGLLLNSLWRLSRVDPGFRAANVLSLGVTFASDLPDPGELHRRRDAVLERLRQLPGVVAVGGSKTMPLQGQSEPYDFALPARPDERILPAGGAFIVTPGYFRALGIPLLRGREFAAGESREQPTVIVNAALARQLWGTADAVGKTVLFGDRPVEVVGVVGDVRTQGLGAAAPAALYVGAYMAARSNLKIFVRTAGDPAALAGAVRAAIHQVEPDLPVFDVAPLAQVVSRSLLQPRLFATLLGLFSALALVLTVVGLYGVVSFAVAQRTREIAVRMALGAERGAVLRMVLKRVASLSGAGLAIGLVAALALARVLAGQLFGVSARDPLTFGTVAVALALAALLAGYVPARRAVGVAPAHSLRGE